MPELEDSLRNSFESLGDLVLFLKQKSIDGQELDRDGLPLQPLSIGQPVAPSNAGTETDSEVARLEGRAVVNAALPVVTQRHLRNVNLRNRPSQEKDNVTGTD